MNREIYLWALFFIAVIAGALYFRYYYQPGINLSLKVNAAQGSAFPYQKVDVPITLTNVGGSPITNLSFGVFVNGQLHTLYKVTLPPRRNVTIPFNLTFSGSGKYNVEAIADPDKLYNIVNRSSVQDNVSIYVYNDSADRPYEYLPSGAVARQDGSMDNFGFDAASYLEQNYNISQYSVFKMTQVNGFLEPIINLTSAYIRNLSYSYAVYENGTAYSLWMNGYVEPGIIGIAARAANLSTATAGTGVGNVTLVYINGNTTVCSWYEGGWIKVLAYEGNAPCTSLLGHNSTGLYWTLVGSKPYSGLTRIYNGSADANFSSWSLLTKVASAGTLKLGGNRAVTLASVSSNQSVNSTCYGVISTLNGTNFCSIYLLQSGGIIRNLSLIRTYAVVNSYNLSVLALTNTSAIESQIGESMALINGLDVYGKSVNFTSGVKNTCLFNANFTCTNATLMNDTLYIKLRSLVSSPINITGISCFWNTPGPRASENYSLAFNQSADISALCYNSTNALSGGYINLKLGLVVDYNSNGRNLSDFGSAYIVKSG